MKSLLIFILIVFCASVYKSDARQAPINVGTTQCLCPVTANINYVCGSNGSTYVNPSALECAKKCTNTEITQVHPGRCP